MLQRDSHFSGFFRDVRCDGETFAIMLVRNKNRNLPEERVERATLNNTFARRRQAPHHSYSEDEHREPCRYLISQGMDCKSR